MKGGHLETQKPPTCILCYGVWKLNFPPHIHIRHSFASYRKYLKWFTPFHNRLVHFKQEEFTHTDQGSNFTAVCILLNLPFKIGNLHELL